MQVLIKMDENLYTRLFDNGVEFNTDDQYELEQAVRHGKVLPNEKLISEAEILRFLKCPEYEKCSWKNCYDCNKSRCINLNNVNCLVPIVDAESEEE